MRSLSLTDLVDIASTSGTPKMTIPITKVSEPAASLRTAADDPETADYLVRVKWLKTVDLSDAVHETGFFGNQNSVARPRSPKWERTVARLKKRFGVD